MEDFVQVQEEISHLLLNSKPEVDAASIQLWNKNFNPQVQYDDLDDIKNLPEEYYCKPKKSEALFLTIRVLSSSDIEDFIRFAHEYKDEIAVGKLIRIPSCKTLFDNLTLFRS